MAKMKANDRQVGGKHYKQYKIQPWDAILDWKLDYLSGNAIAYIVRHVDKGGKEDLEKAIHYLEKRLETM